MKTQKSIKMKILFPFKIRKRFNKRNLNSKKKLNCAFYVLKANSKREIRMFNVLLFLLIFQMEKSPRKKKIRN
jgi:hypothetical protein